MKKKRRLTKKNRSTGGNGADVNVIVYRNPLHVFKELSHRNGKLENVNEMQTEVYLNEDASSFTDSINNVDSWLTEVMLYGRIQPNIKTLKDLEPIYYKTFSLKSTTNSKTK